MTSIAKLFYILFFLKISITAQIAVNKIEPPNWWSGMKLKNIQLMIYGDNLAGATAVFSDKRISVTGVSNIENQSYLFIDVELDNTLPAGDYELILKKEGEAYAITYPIYERENNESSHQGFDNSDVIYLITPDRFANGDTNNDEADGVSKDYDPKNPLGRHGGDIKGIIDHLGYLDELGITAIWINPLVENNTRISYHGYSATDFYNIDPRFGTNKLYKKLVEEAHARGIKLIWDHVSNHISIDHPWMSNLPTLDWIHGTKENHYNALHHKMVLSDIHGDPFTYKLLTEGWFVDWMPDLNQRNEYVKNYIIQNTIWWIEYSGLDGIREDTYPYAGQKFLSEWAGAVLTEYPTLNIVGEVWTGQPAFLAFYQSGSYLPREYDSNLPSVTDFGFRDVMYGYLKGGLGLYEIFQLFSQDNLYPDPDNLVTFIDNHDVTRLMLAAAGDFEKAKIALTILLTSRGIPQILYATEIGMAGGEDHGLLRSDFPGGFPGTDRNAFIAEGRTKKENELFDFLRDLILLRKYYPALHKGKMIHLPPNDGVYIYFKQYEEQLMMVAVNESDQQKQLEPWLVKSVIGDYKEFQNVKNITVKFTSGSPVLLKAKEAAIFQVE